MKIFLGLLAVFSLFLAANFVRRSPRVEQKITDSVQKIEEITQTIAPRPTVINADGLPDSHLIRTAFVPQAPQKDWSQPWQDACEEASLLTVNYFYRGTANPEVGLIVSDLNSLFRYETGQGWGHDVNIGEMAQIATAEYGLHPEIIENPDVDMIKRRLAGNIPVVITANGKTLYAENKHFKSGGPWYHSLVILGYNDRNRQFIVHDVGTQFGSYYRYSYDLLIKSIHDLPDSRNKEQIDLGAKRVLVLLK